LFRQHLEGAQYDLEDAERSLAFEYVLILEELSPACSLIPKQTKDKDVNAQTHIMTEVLPNLLDSIV